MVCRRKVKRWWERPRRLVGRGRGRDERRRRCVRRSVLRAAHRERQLHCGRRRKERGCPHPDGSHRRLYCVESPESWFEDFREGALVCGEASIALDSDFAAVVDASKYHVFLTAHRSNADLAVTERSPDGFRVLASEGAEGTFSWRVVAKRKDIPAPA